MLLNPSVQGDQKLEGLSADPFDRPIPGQSLTSTPKAWPWENPPEFTDVDEAFMYIIEKYKEIREYKKVMIRLSLWECLLKVFVILLLLGICGRFMDSRYSRIIKTSSYGFLMLYSQEKGLPFVPFNNDDPSDKTSIDNMSSYDFFDTMKENNPEAHSQIGQAMQIVADEYTSKNEEIKNMQGSFLVDMPEGDINNE